jgi:Family of unknown function (DUF5677)
MPRASKLSDRMKALRLADSLVRKPLVWSRSSPVLADPKSLGFVMFRGFVRAVSQYRALVILLKSGQWEDALVLVRSLYELDLNLSEIASARDQVEKAGTFVAFGKFQQVRLLQMRLEDELRDERSNARPSAEAIAACEQKLTAITARLERDFGRFRAAKGKRKWQDSWSDASVETLAQRLAQHTGARPGQHDYWVFRLGSLFTHNAPGALLFAMPPDAETADWKTFSAQLDKAGADGLRFFLAEASLCLIDIVGMAGSFIPRYDAKWFRSAGRLLERF